jgi:hypothetical protein
MITHPEKSILNEKSHGVACVDKIYLVKAICDDIIRSGLKKWKSLKTYNLARKFI